VEIRKRKIAGCINKNSQPNLTAKTRTKIPQIISPKQLTVIKNGAAIKIKREPERTNVKSCKIFLIRETKHGVRGRYLERDAVGETKGCDGVGTKIRYLERDAGGEIKGCEALEKIDRKKL
jgi:hypothetical protein